MEQNQIQQLPGRIYLNSYSSFILTGYFVLILLIIFYYAPVLSMCRNINFLCSKCCDAFLEARHSPASQAQHTFYSWDPTTNRPPTHHLHLHWNQISSQCTGLHCATNHHHPPVCRSVLSFSASTGSVSSWLEMIRENSWECSALSQAVYDCKFMIILRMTLPIKFTLIMQTDLPGNSEETRYRTQHFKF